MNENQEDNKVSSMLSIPTVDTLSENQSMPEFSTFTSPCSSPQRERFRGNQKKELKSIISSCVKAQQANRKTCLRARESFSKLNTTPPASEQLFEAHYVKIRKIGEVKKHNFIVRTLGVIYQYLSTLCLSLSLFLYSHDYFIFLQLE